MRIEFATAILAALTFTAPMLADEVSDSELDQTSTLDMSDDNNDLEQDGWNKWQCWAKRRGATWWGQTFVGASHYFRPGSGEGQYARSIAELIANRNCEFNLSRYFTYDPTCEVTNCQVQRY